VGGWEGGRVGREWEGASGSGVAPGHVREVVHELQLDPPSLEGATHRHGARAARRRRHQRRLPRMELAPRAVQQPQLGGRELGRVLFSGMGARQAREKQTGLSSTVGWSARRRIG